MIYNTTHKNRKIEAAISNSVGKGYSFFKSLQMGGTGSKRMIIEQVSTNLLAFKNSVSDLTYANLEIREIGIVVHINKGLQNFSWPIPFYQLHTYKNNGFSIHACGNFIRFKNNVLLKDNKNFIEKIIDLKIENCKNYEFENTIN